ncbi:MAG: carboxylating nicotinate-nucleotide diphosphorylase [Syntrophobacterales bacterium]|nr:carboxylating nicotinate-nucleotide diphosphorylase [Syntrophobacterales bacterium]
MEGPLSLDRFIESALEEDIGSGDVTTNAIVSADLRGRAEIIAKKPCVISGIDVAIRVFKYLDPEVTVSVYYRDGDEVTEGSVICTLVGYVRGLLGAERVALNLLQHLSGIATLTRCFVRRIEEAFQEDGISGVKCQILDTRKTTPLLRSLEKKAVRDGGGKNHRFGLFDGVLIKENHIVAAGGSIKEAIRRVRSSVHHLLKVEVEVESIDQLREAIEAGADAVLLDNFPPDELKKAVALCRGLIPCEISGGVSLENVKFLAKLGADFISTGAITHSAPAVDMSMRLREIFSRTLEGGR